MAEANPSATGVDKTGVTQIRVLCSGAFKAAFELLAPGFEKASGHKLDIAWGSSVAGAPTSIPNRLERGDPVDLVIMAGEGLDKLIGAGRIAAGSRVDLARSGIGVAVRAGAARPDLSSAEAFLRALRGAQSLAHSSSASGIYIKALLHRLGVTEALGDRIRQVEGEPVGRVVAREEAEIGFQQMSELLPVNGIDIVGPLPAELQHVTVFSAGLAAHAVAPEAARALVTYLTAPAAAPSIRQSGMEPA